MPASRPRRSRKTFPVILAFALASALPAPVLAAADPVRIYFEHGSATVGATPQETLDLVAAALLRRGFAEVELVGTADSSGSAAANIAMSRRRAAAVRDLLVARGIPAAKIRVRAAGEASRAYATADEVREPLNRTVEIHISWE